MYIPNPQEPCSCKKKDNRHHHPALDLLRSEGFSDSDIVRLIDKEKRLRAMGCDARLVNPERIDRHDHH